MDARGNDNGTYDNVNIHGSCTDAFDGHRQKKHLPRAKYPSDVFSFGMIRS
jgi:hypothetical protein